MPAKLVSDQEQDLQTVANSIMKELESKCSMKIGEVIDHPDGYKVKVISGFFQSGKSCGVSRASGVR